MARQPQANASGIHHANDLDAGSDTVAAVLFACVHCIAWLSVAPLLSAPACVAADVANRSRGLSGQLASPVGRVLSLSPSANNVQKRYGT